MTAKPRPFGFLDHLALWGSLGITLYVMPFGSLLVPALSLERAFLAVVVAAALGALLVGAVAAVAAHTGKGTVDLLAGLLGERSRPLVVGLLLLRNVVWAAFALSIIAGSAELVSQRALGAGLRPLWIVLFGAAGAALVAAGPDFAVRRLLRRAGIWIALLVAAGVTLSAYLEFDVPAYLQRPAVGGWPSFWQAVDVMLVVPLLWLPVVADFGRLGRGPREAFGGSFLGLLVATVWFGYLGVVYLPAVESGDIAGFVVGMQLGLGALVILLVLQTDEVFANTHAAGEAVDAVLPAARRWAGPTAAAAAVVLALAGDQLRFEGSLLLVASVFVPLFGVLMADFLWTRGRAVPSPASALGAWALGFFLYQWVAPPDVGWWRDSLDWWLAGGFGLPFPLTDEVTWLGAAIPSFLAGVVLHSAGRAALAWRRPRPAAAPAT